MGESKKPEEWAVVEIMGHNRTAGRIEEVQRFGATLLRVDRPHADGTFTTEFYGGQAIYRLRPCEEAIARQVAAELYDERPYAPLKYREREAPAAIEHRGSSYDDEAEDETEPMF